MKRARRATSLVEVLFAAAIGVVVVIALMNVLVRAWHHDAWNDQRIDAVSELDYMLESLRRDLWRSQAGGTDPQENALEFYMGGQTGEESSYVIYRWTGPGQRLIRNGKPLGPVKPLDFSVLSEGSTGILKLTLPSSFDGKRYHHQTDIRAPLVVPDAVSRDRLAFWSPAPKA